MGRCERSRTNSLLVDVRVGGPSAAHISPLISPISPHISLLVDVRVGGPSAAQHEELDLVDGVAVLGESGGAVGQLHHGVEACSEEDRRPSVAEQQLWRCVTQGRDRSRWRA